ncbi:hypothetical protein GW17_00011782 [Ensete ventricosum]|nr:hypothetical protein GW17_00011782 [Ensete ventricosum]
MGSREKDKEGKGKEKDGASSSGPRAAEQGCSARSNDLKKTPTRLGRLANARQGDIVPFFLASSPRMARRKPAGEESLVSDGSRGELGKIKYLPIFSLFFFSTFFFLP